MYDIEIFLPVCLKYKQRIEDLKKYGIINIKNRKVLLSLLIEESEFELIKNASSGWLDGIDVNLVKCTGNYIQNVFDYFLKINFEKPKSRWIMRIDDDSATDVDRLIYNLDRYYDHTQPFYLTCNYRPLEGAEINVVPEYLEYMGRFKEIHQYLKHEIESCILSMPGVEKILKNEKSKRLLEKRATIKGGTTDVCLAFASAMAMLYPVECIFLSHQPEINKFSMFDSSEAFKNHIHLISRFSKGENFSEEQRPNNIFTLLTKIIEKKHNQLESKIMENRFIFENEHEIKLYEFRDNYTVRIKNNHESLFWFAENEKIIIIDNYLNFYFLNPLENGCLEGKIGDDQIKLFPLSLAHEIKI